MAQSLGQATSASSTPTASRHPMRSMYVFHRVRNARPSNWIPSESAHQAPPVEMRRRSHSWRASLGRALPSSSHRATALGALCRGRPPGEACRRHRHGNRPSPLSARSLGPLRQELSGRDRCPTLPSAASFPCNSGTTSSPRIGCPRVRHGALSVGPCLRRMLDTAARQTAAPPSDPARREIVERLANRHVVDPDPD